MFTLNVTYSGYSGDQLVLSFSGDNYVILLTDYAVHMSQIAGGYLQAPDDQFPLAINPKQLAEYGDRASWRDTAFNMTGRPVVFLEDGQIACEDNHERRLCIHGDDGRRVYWSTSKSDPDTTYLVFTKVPYGK